MPPPSSPRILIVDDESLIAMLLEDFLSELGYLTVGPANSVKSALDLIEQGAIDAAIVDVALGEEDSAPIAAALCARDIPFAFATGQGGSKVAARFSDAQVLLKPFDFEGVKGMLARLLGP